MAPVIYYQVKKRLDEPSGSSSCLGRASLDFCISTLMGWDVSPSQIISPPPHFPGSLTCAHLGEDNQCKSNTSCLRKELCLWTRQGRKLLFHPLEQR